MYKFTNRELMDLIVTHVGIGVKLGKENLTKEEFRKEMTEIFNDKVKDKKCE